MTAVRLYGRGHAEAGKKCHHLHEHRLSCSEYEDFRKRAGGLCEICGISEEHLYRQMLVLDHCHRSGRIRGMLCQKCNTVMACYDGTKTWGANKVRKPEADLYAQMSLLWGPFTAALKRQGSDWETGLVDHARAYVREHGNDHERAELAAAEEELAARRARKGGRPAKSREPGA
ncbi:endonuclease domain-containing protein [Streptomyces sp. wa1063]|uniref:endonuclease domain-containing protein n=1 Tax=Streptomyces sp. wa1063 TaxID=1828212 RepID=UPI000BF144CB|nr:endonuclease domain-containing protein [Streptomyces sp. wa1063]